MATAAAGRATTRFLRAAVAAALCLAAAACAQPIAGLWPPGPGDVTHRIVVSTDAWHSVIGLCRENGQATQDAPSAPAAAPEATRQAGSPRFEEWGFAEKGYYLEGDNGVCGTLRALFLPSAGVVSVTRGDRTWAERTPQPPGRSWEFDLTDAGFARLAAFLRAEVASPTPISHAGGAEWFDAASSYHAFHHCHHWTASALREAGLPVRPAFALFKWSLESQLDRAERIGAEMADGDGD